MHSGLLGDLIVMYAYSFLDITEDTSFPVLSREDFCANLQELVERAAKRQYG